MKIGTVLLISLVLLVTVCCFLHANNGGQWYKGIIHIHTTFSDGSDNIPQRVAEAKSEGCQFIVITDHYEQIDKKDKAGDNAGTDFGFSDYLRNCREQTGSDFCTIPGAEIACFWNPESDKQATAHTLILGFADFDQKLANSLKNDTQQEIINRIKELGYLSVAAHPSLITDNSLRWYFWQGSDFRHDLRPANEHPSGSIQYQGLNGIEMFNIEHPNQQKEAVKKYLSLINQKIPVFVTAGCDSHKWFPYDAAKDKAMWGRQTWVFASDLSEKSILQALKEGKSYAANYRVRFDSLQPTPCFQPKKVNVAKFKFSVVFERPPVLPKTVQVYRDGELVKESVYQHPAGEKELNYEWCDIDVKTGEHWYVIEVPMMLITSPIVLDITDQQIPVSQEAKAVVLVMDASGSMKGQKIISAKRAAEAFIDLMNSDDWVGITEFSVNTKLSLVLTQINSVNKSELKDRFYQTPELESTNIGAGLELGVNQLDNLALPKEQKSLVLMTDGCHNTGELWPAVELCKQKGYKVYTVAFGYDADLATLEKIAAQTGGECSYSGMRNLAQIYNFISTQIKKESVFYASSYWIHQDQKLSYQVPICSQTASFFVDWQGSLVETAIINPQGTQVKTSEMERAISGENYTIYQLKNPPAGKWQVQLIGKEIPTEGEQINLSIAGQDEVYVSLFPLKNSYSLGEEIRPVVKISAIDQNNPLKNIQIKGSICQPPIRPDEIISHKKINLGNLLFRAVDQTKPLSFNDLGDNKFAASFKSKIKGLHRIYIDVKLTLTDSRIIERKIQASVIVGSIEEFTINDFLQMFR